jgi:hypothetical protein
VLLLTDLYYLDHYGKSAHFPGHAVMLAGYDSEQALLSDTAFDQLQRTGLANLAEARAAQHPAYPLEGHMVDLPAGAKLSRDDLVAATPRAIARAAKEMLEPSLGEYQGIPALVRLADEVEAWPREAEDAQWCARFLYQVIERRGTGGGNFRRMYADFLKEAGYAESALASEAAERWTALAEAARAASETEALEEALWSEVGSRTRRVLEAERELWTALSG